MDELIKLDVALTSDQQQIEQLDRYYHIIDSLLVAAKINPVAFLAAREKINLESLESLENNENSEFARMAGKLSKEQLIKLRIDLNLVDLLKSNRINK